MNSDFTIMRNRWITANGQDDAGYTIGPLIWEYISKHIRPGMFTLELGSGLSTWLFTYAGCYHTAVEHSPEHWGRVMREPFMQDARTVVDLRRLVPVSIPSPPGFRTATDDWYAWEPHDVGADNQLILIDGPPGDIGRTGVLSILPRALADGGIIVIDDCNREDERELAGVIGVMYQKPVKYHPAGDGTQFGVIHT